MFCFNVLNIRSHVGLYVFAILTLVVIWFSRWHHAHIVIQSYTYNHTNHTHTIMQWCCTRVYETFLWKAVPIYPWSLRLHRCSSADWLSDPWSLRLSPVQFTGVMVGSLVSAAATCSSPNRLSSLLPLRLRPGSCPGRFSKRWCLHLPPLEFRGLTVRSLDSASATCAVYQVDFQNVGVRACHRRSSAGWLSDLWSACHPCNLREWWLDQVARIQPSLW